MHADPTAGSHFAVAARFCTLTPHFATSTAQNTEK